MLTFCDRQLDTACRRRAAVHRSGRAAAAGGGAASAAGVGLALVGSGVSGAHAQGAHGERGDGDRRAQSRRQHAQDERGKLTSTHGDSCSIRTRRQSLAVSGVDNIASVRKIVLAQQRAARNIVRVWSVTRRRSQLIFWRLVQSSLARGGTARFDVRAVTLGSVRRRRVGGAALRLCAHGTAIRATRVGCLLRIAELSDGVAQDVVRGQRRQPVTFQLPRPGGV